MAVLITLVLTDSSVIIWICQSQSKTTEFPHQTHETKRLCQMWFQNH